MPANLRASYVALERRVRTRYPLELKVRYHTVSNRPALVGTGRTVNVSSFGLLIASDQRLVDEGSRLRISVEWPCTLDGATPLQLTAVCRVVRCDPSEFAVRIESHQFRTKSSRQATASRP